MKKFNYIKKMIIFNYMFIFIIINSMIPSKSNINKVYQLNTIIPGFENIYNDNNINDKTYSFKFIEILQNIF